jgi:hypothetical protein
MHEIEPFYNWEDYYKASEDELSPFFGEESNMLEYTNQVYNYYIHPSWDYIGSRTLYMKLLYVDYEKHYAILEFIGEWNDAVENDIMQLKREIIDVLLQNGIYKYILLCENVLNFHADGNDYYEEWEEEVVAEEGYIAMVNMPRHCIDEMKSARLTKYFWMLDYDKWRTHQPKHFYHYINDYINNTLG